MSQHTKAGAFSSGVGVAFGSAVVVGWFDRSSVPERLHVDYPGNARGPLVARSTLQLGADPLAVAVAARQAVLLVFENGDPALPIVIGVIQTPESNALGALLATPRATAAPSKSQARVDGDRVVFEAEREVVLECGDASLTLRRDGKVLIRGAYVETYSKGVNRIKGGTVKIN